MTRALILVFAAGALSHAQTIEPWCVLENTGSHSMFHHNASRIDWVSIAKCGDVAWLGPDWTLAPVNQPNLTFAGAAALADAYRVNFGAPASDSDAFHRRCDRSYSVWQRNPGGPFAFTHDSTVSGFTLFRANLCCEDAAALSFPASGGDCRSFRLLSVPGVMVTIINGRFTPSTGTTVTIPSNPPVTLSPAAGGGPGSATCAQQKCANHCVILLGVIQMTTECSRCIAQNCSSGR